MESFKKVFEIFSILCNANNGSFSNSLKNLKIALKIEKTNYKYIVAVTDILEVLEVSKIDFRELVNYCDMIWDS